ncbi:MAG: glycosyl hydrolase [Bacteroidetes bacterium]|nr:glycosyl hydrolase [Bacteroidota bacterium]MCH8523386.1 glycosyl hydrolase [Balneolales bacterium]
MSFRSENYLNYKGIETLSGNTYLKNKTEEQRKKLFSEILEEGVHGFCFSLYEEGQKPGDIISEDQIRRRLRILKPYTSWVRSFSCTEGNELIPRIAKEMGIKTLVGAWLGSDLEKNREELDGLIALANEGLVDVAAVGNEVLYRKDLSEEELLAYINEIKEVLPGRIPVGYVDAYYEFVQRPAISDACDVILCNCYPYWEGTPFEYAYDHMKHMYDLAVQAGKGKPVMVTETGWPSKGEGLGGAMPSHENARDYFINAQLWSAKDDIPMFYFASFDEAWKVGAEGEVGGYWGIWDSKEKLKF